MYQSILLLNSMSTMEVPSAVRPDLSRAPTPGPEERFPHTFKSLFTLADVAARRRANRNHKKLTIKTDENSLGNGSTMGSSALLSLRRSKSSGDVAVLGENMRALNVVPLVDDEEKGTGSPKNKKAGRARAATTSSAPPSKIPKAKSPRSLNPASSPPSSAEDDYSILSTNISGDSYGAEALSVVDDALFLMLTPPQTPPRKAAKKLTLAAHAPSLPKVASPFSPRTSQSWAQHPLHPRASPRFSPSTGHTSASLHLTKSHWELRYEEWIRSLRRPRSARSVARRTSLAVNETFHRSRFPEPLTNPALFPRAGSLSPKALHAKSDGLFADEDDRSALEIDWALRGWPMDKIQRTLFMHDMDVRVWFPVTPPASKKDSIAVRVENDGSEMDLTRAPAGLEDEGDLKEDERALRRWEWDWELRWKIMEGMAEDDGDRDGVECEYDVFLAKERCQEDDAYGGCEVKDVRTRDEEDWEWNEDAMEIDSVQ